MISIRKTIPETSNFYTRGGDTTIVLAGAIELITHSKKSLIKINRRKTKSRQTSENSDEFDNKVIDLKNGTDDFVLRAWITDEIELGTASSGASTTLTDSTKSWSTNQFTGFTVSITSGTGSGQSKTVYSNTSTAITVDSAWSTNPDATSVYEITSTAWEKYWKIRAMCSRGGSLDNLTIENLEFKDSTQEAFLEEVVGTIKADDTGSLETSKGDGIARIELSLTFFIGNER